MMIAITATPPAAPPATAAALELLPPGCGAGPMTSPGRTSGVSIKWSEIVTRGKDRGDDAHHRRHTIRWGPKCSRPRVRCDYRATEGTLATYCDIEKSPVRNTNPGRDRVWKPAGQTQCQTQQFSLLPQGAHDEGGKVVVQ